ncbi:MAG: TonB family protein [bacterium]
MAKKTQFLTVRGMDIVNQRGERVILKGFGLGGWMKSIPSSICTPCQATRTTRGDKMKKIIAPLIYILLFFLTPLISISGDNIVINSCYYHSRFGPFVSYDDDKVFLTVNFTITNVWGEALQVDALRQAKVIDTYGNIYFPIGLVREQDKVLGNIPPGEEMRGEVSFIVPKPDQAKVSEFVFDCGSIQFSALLRDISFYLETGEHSELGTNMRDRVQERRLLYRWSPEYPEWGYDILPPVAVVRVRVWVAPAGIVRKTEIIESSGYPKLDAYTEDKIRAWRWEPIDPSMGDQWGEITVTYRREGEGR